MSSVFGVKLFRQVFVTLLVIMDPPGDGVRAADRPGGAVHGVRDRAGGGHRPAVAYHAFLRGIHRLPRPSGVELLTRIAGLRLSAIAVQLVVGAIRAFVTTG